VHLSNIRGQIQEQRLALSLIKILKIVFLNFSKLHINVGGEKILKEPLNLLKVHLDNEILDLLESFRQSFSRKRFPIWQKYRFSKIP
jgi:hypothetical protein